MLVLITYDINTLKHNYDSLYNYLRSYKVWWHYLSDTWIIGNNSNDTINLNELCAAIQSHLLPEDKFFLTEIDPSQSNGLLPPKAWDWLNKQENNSRKLT